MAMDDCNHSVFRRLISGVAFNRRTTHAILLGIACLAPAMGISLAQTAPAPGEKAEQFRQAGLSQVAGGHIDEAIASFKSGLQIAPRDARLLDAIGAAYSLKNDLETAQQYFVESLRVDPTSIPTRQNLGIALFSLGRYEEASKQFAVIQEEPGKPREVASLFLGLIAARQSNCTEALPLLEASGGLLYQYPDAALSYSECQYEKGHSRLAMEGLAVFEHLAGKTPAQYRRAAGLYARLGLHAASGEDRNKAQTAESNSPSAVLKQALLLEKAHRPDEAQKILEEGTARHPTFDLLLELASIAKKRGDFAIAMKSLKRASQIEPGREESYLEFSRICADHGNDQLALDSAKIGLEHVPGSYQLMVQEGVVQEKLGRLKEAEETLRKAISMQKDNSIALLSLAVVQAHSGRTDAAEETLAEAIRQFPDNYYMYYFQGKLLIQFGANKPDTTNLEEAAKESFERAIQLNPTYADSYYQLSSLYMPGAPKLSEMALQKCLKLDPGHIAAQYALARLYLRTGRRAAGEEMLAHLKTEQRSQERQQQRQLLIVAAQK
jgi:tetratricopeptide (TPR) repeat protein